MCVCVYSKCLNRCFSWHLSTPSLVPCAHPLHVDLSWPQSRLQPPRTRWRPRPRRSACAVSPCGRSPEKNEAVCRSEAQSGFRYGSSSAQRCDLHKKETALAAAGTAASAVSPDAGAAVASLTGARIPNSRGTCRRPRLACALPCLHPLEGRL